MIFTVMYEMTVWRSRERTCLEQLGDLHKGDSMVIIAHYGGYNLCLTKFGLGFVYATR